MNNVKQVIVIRKDLNMRKGKLAAQAAHCSSLFMINRFQSSENGYLFVPTPEEAHWIQTSFAKIVVSVNSDEELQEIINKAKLENLTVYDIIDHGKTEFHGVPTRTACCIGPHESHKIDPITGHLQLL